jgi:hypothetical protein
MFGERLTIAVLCVSIRDGKCRIPHRAGKAFKIIIDDAHTISIKTNAASTQCPFLPSTVEECPYPVIAENVISFYQITVSMPERKGTETFPKCIMPDYIIAGFNGDILRIAIAAFEEIIFQ